MADYGGYLAASCYHIGSHERYITDFWTTNNDSLFVTEVLVKVSRRGSVVHTPKFHFDSDDDL